VPQPASPRLSEVSLSLAAQRLRANPGQWDAYESKGSCLVLAGPGSGKTRTLVTKIARMLAEDVKPPAGIACITYSNECARELRRRLRGLGVTDARNVYIGTVHSFCLSRIVLPYAELGGVALPVPLTVASAKMQKEAFERAKQGSGASRVDFDAYRRTRLDRAELQWKGDDPELADIIERYENDLRDHGMLDFDDMVLVGLRLAEREAWVREALRARYPIVAIDEYQDLGGALHRIALALLADGNVRLLAVGDPDQSIYGFAGARPELLKELSARPEIQTVRLRFNYRCGGTIVKGAEAALGEPREYESVAGYDGVIEFHECPNGLREQATYVCSVLVPALLQGGSSRTLGDIAILYTNKNDGEVVAQHVDDSGFKYIRIDQGAPYAKTPVTRWLEDCARWCSGGWRTGAETVSDIARAFLAFAGAEGPAKDRLRRRALIAFLFSHRDPDVLLFDWLKTAYEALLKEVLSQPTLSEESDAFAKLAKACTPGARWAGMTLGSFGGQGGSPDHLNLMTLHSAKGLEFDVVIMVGVDEGNLPNWSCKTGRQLAQERRLFYVGLTRAKREVHLVYSGWTQNRYGTRFSKGPSRFLAEVGDAAGCQLQ